MEEDLKSFWKSSREFKDRASRKFHIHSALEPMANRNLRARSCTCTPCNCGDCAVRAGIFQSDFLNMRWSAGPVFLSISPLWLCYSREQTCMAGGSRLLQV